MQISLLRFLLAVFVLTAVAGQAGIAVKNRLRRISAVSQLGRDGAEIYYDFAERYGIAQQPMKRVGQVVGNEFVARSTHLDWKRKQTGRMNFKPIALLDSLKSVNMTRSSVHDDDVAVLARLPRLEHLYLPETLVTDECVPHLGRMKQLEVLDVSGTQITQRGIAKLQAALPDTFIEFSVAQRRQAAPTVFVAASGGGRSEEFSTRSPTTPNDEASVAVVSIHQVSLATWSNSESPRARFTNWRRPPASASEATDGTRFRRDRPRLRYARNGRRGLGRLRHRRQVAKHDMSAAPRARSGRS